MNLRFEENDEGICILDSRGKIVYRMWAQDGEIYGSEGSFFGLPQRLNDNYVAPEDAEFFMRKLATEKVENRRILQEIVDDLL